MITTTARRATAAAATTALLGALVVGCGSEKSAEAAVPEGWRTLDAQQVSVAYPKGFKELAKDKLPKTATAEADLVEGGKTVARIVAQVKFMKTSDLDMAVAGAEAPYELGGTPKGKEDIKVAGAGKAVRIDHEFKSSGEDDSPPRDTEMTAVDIVGMDKDDRPWVVRITAPKGKLSQDDLDGVIKSVKVTG
ncbi:hypothetical protein FGW37_20870 [Streptomyces rectiverticillatus]|uniref:hypothetical protein n=1 Tax=Streptomyces rectiverticillatus TaxID=173860 RepID=UPI0015C325DB|nr:hypothetical protein [Streptomyces rectiverticillatus]QLE73705.1 hypothetical protein FGW37_20870 [Streptomyces rectiverticillatus]